MKGAAIITGIICITVIALAMLAAATVISIKGGKNDR